jgi:hypothetical protein
VTIWVILTQLCLLEEILNGIPIYGR